MLKNALFDKIEFEVSLGVSICLDLISIKTLDLDTSKSYS